MKRCLAVSLIVLTFLVAVLRAIPSDDKTKGCTIAILEVAGTAPCLTRLREKPLERVFRCQHAGTCPEFLVDEKPDSRQRSKKRANRETLLTD